MKPYLVSVGTAAGGFLVVGLDSWPARLVAVLILVAATTILGMVLEAEPATTED